MLFSLNKRSLELAFLAKHRIDFLAKEAGTADSIESILQKSGAISFHRRLKYFHQLLLHVEEFFVLLIPCSPTNGLARIDFCTHLSTILPFRGPFFNPTTLNTLEIRENVNLLVMVMGIEPRPLAH